MKISPTWIINFGDVSYAENIKACLIDITDKYDDWIVCDNIEAYVKGTGQIAAFFDDEKYKNVFSQKINQIRSNLNEGNGVDLSLLKIILIGDLREELTRNLMNLFAFNLRQKSNSILTGNMLMDTDTSVSITAILFSENDWKKEVREEFSKFLFELNLLQSIPIGPLKPYNSVLFFKDINTIGQYGEILNPDNHIFKLAQLILHLALIKTEIVPDSKDYNYCTVGGCTLYFDYGEITIRAAEKATTQLITRVKSNLGSSPWLMDDREISGLLNVKLKELEPKALFKALQCASEKFEYNESMKKGEPHSWFIPLKLKTFFEEDVRKFIESLLNRRSTFMSAVYSKINNEVKKRALQQMELLKQLEIQPAPFVQSVFKEKNLSIGSLRTVIERYKSHIDNLLKDYKDFYEANFVLVENGVEKQFEPFPVIGKTKMYYDDFVEEFDKSTSELYVKKEKNLRENLFGRLEKIPHPLSYFIRSILLGTLLAMLSYIPLTHLISEGSYQIPLIACVCLVLFIIPVVLMRIDYNGKINSLSEDEARYEALVRYIARRRIMVTINSQVVAHYDKILALCDEYASRIDDFCRKETPKMFKAPSSIKESPYFINISQSINSEINSTTNDFDSQNGLMSDEKMFSLWKEIVKSGFDNNQMDLDIVLNDYEGLCYNILMCVNEELKKSSGNATCIADLLFKDNRCNINETLWKAIQNKMIPYFNRQENRKIDWEIKIFPNDKDPKELHVSKDLENCINGITIAPAVYHDGFRMKIASLLMVVNTNSSSGLKYIFSGLDSELEKIIVNPADSTRIIIDNFIDCIVKNDPGKFQDCIDFDENRGEIMKEFKDWSGNSMEKIIGDESGFFRYINEKLDRLKNN